MKKLRYVWLTAIVIFLMAGCAGDKTPKAPADATPPEETTTPSEGEAPSEGVATPAWIKLFGKEWGDMANGIAVDKNGNVHVVGKTYPADEPSFRPLWLIISPSGDLKSENALSHLSPLSQTMEVKDVAVDKDGYVYLVGNAYREVLSILIFLEKYNSSGDKQWTKILYTSNFLDDLAMANAIAVDNKNNCFYIVGTTNGDIDITDAESDYIGAQDAFVAKYSFDGNLKWVKQFGTDVSDTATGVAVDSVGSVFISGYTDGSMPDNVSAGGFDAFLAKCSVSGCDSIKIKQFGTTSMDSATDVVVDSEGNIYVVGYTGKCIKEGDDTCNLGESDLFVIKYNGGITNRIWEKQEGSDLYDKAYGVAVDSRNNVYVAGSFLKKEDTGDFILYEFNADGTTGALRAQSSGGKLDRATGVALDKDGNVYVTGNTYDDLGGENAGKYDIFVARYNFVLETE